MAKIGIIIPAYNCESFIDDCLKSIVNQSHSDIEILVILGNSTDKTEDKAHEWEKHDARIRVIKQSCGRLGTARNEAIDAIQANIIAFVDADDWIELDFVEKMLSEMEDNDRDMVICDRNNITYGSDGLIEKTREIRMIGMQDDAKNTDENPELIRSIEVSVNGKLYKKNLFIDNHIIQPDIFGEDRAVMPFLISKCKNIGRVRETLYHYRAEHGNNSVMSVKTYFSAAECMEYINNEFEKDQSTEKYDIQLKSVYSAIAGVARPYLRKAKPSEYKDAEAAEKKICNFIQKNNVDPVGKRYIFGSYSARRMVQYAFPQYYEKRESYAYSSIISAMSKAPLEIEKNRTFSTDQRKWYHYDFYKVFKAEFQPEANDVFIIDFLDERFPILQLEDMYFTYSTFIQKHEDILDYFNKNARVVDGEERDNLWMNSCDAFVKLVKSRIDSNRVVLVKNLLSTEYGSIDNRNPFFEKLSINTINCRLRKYYDYFLKIYPEVNLVDIEKTDDHYFYTDEGFEFGCNPWHFNDNYYMHQGTECFKRMRNRYNLSGQG